MELTVRYVGCQTVLDLGSDKPGVLAHTIATAAEPAMAY